MKTGERLAKKLAGSEHAQGSARVFPTVPLARPGPVFIHRSFRTTGPAFVTVPFDMPGRDREGTPAVNCITFHDKEYQ